MMSLSLGVDVDNVGMKSLCFSQFRKYKIPDLFNPPLLLTFDFWKLIKTSTMTKRLVVTVNNIT